MDLALQCEMQNLHIFILITKLQIQFYMLIVTNKPKPSNLLEVAKIKNVFFGLKYKMRLSFELASYPLKCNRAHFYISHMTILILLYLKIAPIMSYGLTKWSPMQHCNNIPWPI